MSRSCAENGKLPLYLVSIGFIYGQSACYLSLLTLVQHRLPGTVCHC
jgi:hypothetical protein